MSNINRIRVQVDDKVDIVHQGMIAVRRETGWSLKCFADDMWDCEKNEEVLFESTSLDIIMSEMRCYIARIFDKDDGDEIHFSESEGRNLWRDPYHFEQETKCIDEFNKLLDQCKQRILDDEHLKTNANSENSSFSHDKPIKVRVKRKRLGKRRGKRRVNV